MNPRHPTEAEIFERASELSGEARAAYLKEATGGDEQLRQRIEKLLHAHDHADTAFLEIPAAAARGGTVVITTNMIQVTEKPGDKIGRYKLREQIGEGGCGVVYVAEQEEPVRRRVALKVIKLGMDTKQVVARFEAERQALALMDHPHIAKVLDAGATDTGRPYFVMELVRGIKITDYCDQNNLATEDRLKLFVQVCAAIQHAHQKGIIHRDIKPSNILVTLHDGVPVPKVIDFGIAKATSDQRLTDKTIYTAFEQFIGTPAYMSPEQAEMSGLDIDTRSDIYSLGVLLYELLTGRTPFDSSTLLKAGLDQMRRIIREQEPQRPSTRLSTLTDADLTAVANHRHAEPPKLVSLVRGDLDWIVMKSLEKDRTRRYETANGFAADLHRHLTHEPVSARPPGGFYRFQKMVRRNKLAFTAATTVAVALMVGLASSSWMFLKEKKARQRAVAAEIAAQVEAARSTQVALFMQDMLKGVGPGVSRGRDTSLLREILDQTASRVDKDLAAQPEVEADLRDTLGAVYRELGDYSKAEAMHREALSIREKLRGNQSLDYSVSLRNLGHVRHYQRSYLEAEAAYRQALEIQQRVLAEESTESATTLDYLGSLLRQMGKLPEAEVTLRRSLEIRKRIFGLEHPQVADSIKNLGLVFLGEGNLTNAESCFRESIALRRKLLGNDHPSIADGLSDLGRTLELQKKFEEAEPLLRESLTLRRRLLGNNHPSMPQTMARLASTFKRLGKFSDAAQLQCERLALQQKLPGTDHSEVAASLADLADTLTSLKRSADKIMLSGNGDLSGAIALYGEVLSCQRSISGDGSQPAINALNDLAQALRRQGKPKQAVELLSESMSLQRKLVAANTNNLVIVNRGRFGLFNG